MKMADQAMIELKEAHPNCHRLEERQSFETSPYHDFLKKRAMGYGQGFDKVHLFTFKDRSRIDVLQDELRLTYMVREGNRSSQFAHQT